MKKLVNNPIKAVDEMIEGYVKAYPNYIKTVGENLRALVTAKETKENKVGVIIGGGAGHEPGFMGYIGTGFADGVPVGNIFASPPPDPILDITKEIDKGAGVIYLYGNYQGDIMNFGMAADLADLEADIRVETVRVTDDVVSAPKDRLEERRGIAGSFFVYKAAGAAADLGYSLDHVVRIANKANDSTRSMGVGLSPCSLPQTGEPSFELADHEMEIGLGVHGEPGLYKGEIRPAESIVNELMEHILADMPISRGEKVAVLVNGLGSTPQMELYIMFRSVAKILEDQGIIIYRSYVGNYLTSLEMGGCSVSLMKLDDELTTMIDHPADCAMFVQK
ncbi:dihydroxyacetone kinase subunit DhaK [Terrilactibacillus laevilacticus]|uniref:Dihydroxyacetone kinase subunit DhaK n=1 Tax=Terrilactibacillus laevilacticus TaxID=1380157 RepID=A0ABW5PT74_9BACI|nr:dihydroxyacetone kinase subunit DhaK [Terrilactibacillus laevilacticus]